MLTLNGFVNHKLFGKSEAFRGVLQRIERFAAHDATVLILGETGTGKELAARAIHYLSSRGECPFLPVNCGAIPDHLVESEFFGHVRGAFTDARNSKPGLVAGARGGTLFLDEIEAMSPRSQVVLLRFLQDREYRPVGGDAVCTADVRIIAACNADLSEMARQKLFRPDLLYRLNKLCLRMPPLRERPGDIAMLGEIFLDRLNRESGRPRKTFHPDSWDILKSYHWPGNVRELENFIYREFVLADGPVIRVTPPGQAQDLSLYGPHVSAPPSAMDGTPAATLPAEADCADCLHQHEDNAELATPDRDLPKHMADAATVLTYGEFRTLCRRVLAELEVTYLSALLARCGGNLSLASRISGRDRSDLCKLRKKHGLMRAGLTREPS
jgi:two-component system response regulator GlrR